MMSYYELWLGRKVALMYRGDEGEDVEVVVGNLSGIKLETEEDGSNPWHWVRINHTWHPLGWLKLKD